MDEIKLLYDMFINLRERVYSQYKEDNTIKLKLLLLSSEHLGLFLEYINDKIDVKGYAKGVLKISDDVADYSKVNKNYMMQYNIIKETVNKI